MTKIIKKEPKKPVVSVDLADTDFIKNVLIKADKEHKQYMIISNLEVWENIEVLVRSLNASMNYLASIGESKMEITKRVADMFAEDISYKVEKKHDEI